MPPSVMPPSDAGSARGTVFVMKLNGESGAVPRVRTLLARGADSSLMVVGADGAAHRTDCAQAPMQASNAEVTALHACASNAYELGLFSRSRAEMTLLDLELALARALGSRELERGFVRECWWLKRLLPGARGARTNTDLPLGIRAWATELVGIVDAVVPCVLGRPEELSGDARELLERFEVQVRRPGRTVLVKPEADAYAHSHIADMLGLDPQASALVLPQRLMRAYLSTRPPMNPDPFVTFRAKDSEAVVSTALVMASDGLTPEEALEAARAIED